MQVDANANIALSQPDFSHTLIPTPSLLSKYSELTLNAHHIHLDTNYARNVEGHRNLLVHGPLSLTLILRLVNNHLAEQRGPPQTVRSIDYRNIAPLYCDEELTLCGRRRDRLDENGHPVFDVWIEGPTGGMAVKGTVHTSPMHYRGSFSAALRLTRHKDGDEGDKRSQGEVAGTLNAPQPPPELKPKSRSKPKPKPRSESKPEYKTISQLLLEANEKYAHLPRKQRRRLFAHEKNRLLQLRTAKNATTNPDAETKPKRKSRPVAAEFPSNPSDPVLALLSDPPLAPTPPQPASQPDDADADVEEKKISYIDRPLPIRYYDTDMEHNAWKKEGRVDLNEDGTPRSIFADRGVTKVFPVRARKVAAMQLGRRWDFSELYSFSAARAMIGRSRRRSLFEKQSRLDGWSGDQDGTSAGVEKSEVWGDRFGGWVSDRDRVVRVRKYEVSGGRGMERGGVRARARREEREERQRRGYEQRYEDAGEEIVDLSSPEEKKKKKNNWRPGSTSLDADGAQELRNLSREEKKISQPGAAPLASYEEPKLRIRKQFYPLITKYRD